MLRLVKVRPAYLRAAKYSNDLDDLSWIDWEMLQRRDFKRDPDDLMKFERYQANALIHRQVPMDARQGVFCCNEDVGHESPTASNNEEPT